MRTVQEVARLTGVSVRTLHHYDAIGLLRPAQVSQAGYRLYDDACLRRLQQILIYRELRFSLQDIKSMLDSPHFDPEEALDGQIRLLEQQRIQLERVIAFARDIAHKGVESVMYEAFDKQQEMQLREEAKARWSQTEAWQEYERHPRKGGREEGEKLMALLASFGEMRMLPPENEEVQKKVQQLQELVTASFYTCTRQILLQLGEMYSADERFRRNIDRAGGEGTAQFVTQAIEVYCRE